MKDCIFCKIIAGEIPSTVVYEDTWTYCIEDIAPQAPVHVLVLSKQHYDNVLHAAVHPGVMDHMMHAAGEVARIKGVRDDGFRLVINTGANAGQSEEHLHVHVLGGKVLQIEMT